MHDRIRRHYDAFFGRERIEEVHWTIGPLASTLPEFHIVKVRPEKPDGMWVFGTIGAWEATSGHNHGVEFIAVARSEAAAVMRTLAMTAYYNSHEPLDVGHTLPIGEGWVSGSPLDHLLVSPPYLWGPRLERCETPAAVVHVLWLLPIYAVEREFKRAHGLEALESRFEERNIDYLDPFRPSVVLPSEIGGASNPEAQS